MYSSAYSLYVYHQNKLIKLTYGREDKKNEKNFRLCLLKLVFMYHGFLKTALDCTFNSIPHIPGGGKYVSSISATEYSMFANYLE